MKPEPKPPTRPTNRSDRRTGRTLAAALALGALAGAAIGLLIAPGPGRDNRRKAARGIDTLLQSAAFLWDVARDAAASSRDLCGHSLLRLVRSVDAGLAEAKDLYDREREPHP